MRHGWVYTHATAKGVIVSIMQTPNRVIVAETPLGGDHIETMLLMSAHCFKRGDYEVYAIYH